MRTKRYLIVAALSVVALVIGVIGPATGHDPTGDQADALKGRLYDGIVEDPSPGGVAMEALSDVKCEDGHAGIFPCHKVDLAAFMPLGDVDATFVNDVWGWTDPETKMQVAIVGTFEGTAFVDVTDGYNPVYLGTLPSAVPDDFGNIWGDIRVYGNAAYIGSEAIDFESFDGFGVQVVDLTQFRGATAPIAVAEANRITDLTNSHNLSLNEDSGRLYVAGSVFALQQCTVDAPDDFPELNGNGASLVYDVATDPLNPEFLGCLTGDGYNHDIQCVIYHGTDLDYYGHEICIGSNEDSLTIYDATDITAPTVVSRIEYQDFPFIDPDTGSALYYTHQGWMSDDHQFFFLGDELDEFRGSVDERTTYIWDLADLDAPFVTVTFSDGNSSIDHNMFVHQGLLYQSNYTSGLWIYDVARPEDGLRMRGYFDVFPVDDSTTFAGTWGNYPYFGQGKVIVTSSDEGVFILQSRASSTSKDAERGYS